MNRSRPGQWWTLLAAIALPAAAVAAVRHALSVEPENAPAPASPRAAGSGGDDAPAMSVTDAQRRMLALASLPDAQGARSPFYVPRSDADTPEPDQSDAMKRPDPREKAPELTSIVTGRETLAVINGKPHRVGDRVADDRTLAEIDAPGGTVTLDSPTRGRLVLRLRRADPTDKASVRESAVDPK